MEEFDLNLSTRPFPAYRLVNLALAAGLMVLLAISAWQAYAFLNYSELASSIRSDEQTVRVESEALRRQVVVLEAKLDRPESTAKLNEIGFLNAIIAKRELSWTQLFASLENMIPDYVALVSLRPEFTPEGPVVLQIDAKGRSMNDIKDFVAALEQSEAFDKVKVLSEDRSSTLAASVDISVTLTANYYPQKEAR
jgi:Tfp pilus assembly protein PilN